MTSVLPDSPGSAVADTAVPMLRAVWAVWAPIFNSLVPLLLAVAFLALTVGVWWLWRFWESGR